MYLIKSSTDQDVVIDSSDSVDNIPSLDQCWLQCITVLSTFANNSFHMSNQVCLCLLLHFQVPEFAVDRLQRCLLRRGEKVPSGMALLKCYDSIILPLLSHYGTNERDRSYIIGITTSTMLASSETLSQQPGYASLWLRFIDLLCSYIREEGGIGEMTTERMKNLLMVMIVEKRFDSMNEVSGQNVLEATMTMLDSYCPSIRRDLEQAFDHSENPKGGEEEVKSEEVKSEEVKEEVKSEEVKSEEVKEKEEKEEVKSEEVKSEEVKEKEEKEEVKSEEVKSEEVKSEEVKKEEEKEEVKEEEKEEVQTAEEEKDDETHPTENTQNTPETTQHVPEENAERETQLPSEEIAEKTITVEENENDVVSKQEEEKKQEAEENLQKATQSGDIQNSEDEVITIEDDVCDSTN